MSIELTTEQARVCKDIVGWVSSCAAPSRRMQHTSISLTGYAGTGKTTLVAEIIKRIQHLMPDKHVIVAAFTGKASSVLAKKLLDAGIDTTRTHASTIHYMIYRCCGKDSQGNLIFKKNSIGPQVPPLEKCALLVIDEASMLNTDIAYDLAMSVPLPTLYVGDVGQLPPVVGKQIPHIKNPTYTLTTIHRQAECNPIIRLATLARLGERLPLGVQSRTVAVMQSMDSMYTSTISSVMRGYSTLNNPLADYKTQVVLAATNNTRRRMNQIARAQIFRDRELGPVTPQFVDAELAVCLRNNRDVFISNGEVLSVTAGMGTIVEGMQRVACTTSLNLEYELGLLCDGVDGIDAAELDTDALVGYSAKAKLEGAASSLLVDYGYALTVHKSQGSEWDKVLLFAHRMRLMTDEAYAQWLYTGITRAKETLAVVV